MEYRQKNLRHKPQIEEVIRKAVNNEVFMKHIDFFGATRKTAFINQNDHNIKASKPCTITSEGLALYLNESMQSFIHSIEQKQHKRHPMYQQYRAVPVKSYHQNCDLLQTKETKLKPRLVEQLKQHLNKNPTNDIKNAINASLSTLDAIGINTTNNNMTFDRSQMPILEFADISGVNYSKIIAQKQAIGANESLLMKNSNNNVNDDIYNQSIDTQSITNGLYNQQNLDKTNQSPSTTSLQQVHYIDPAKLIEQKALQLSEEVTCKELKIAFKGRVEKLLRDVQLDRLQQKVKEAERLRKGSPADSQMSQLSKLKQQNRRGGIKSRDNVSGLVNQSKLTTSSSNNAINQMTQKNGLEIKLRQITPSEERKVPITSSSNRKITDGSISHRLNSRKPSPTHKIQTRGRADTTATKESSQDEEFKNDHVNMQSLIEDRNRNLELKYQGGVIGTRLEKIISISSQDPQELEKRISQAEMLFEQENQKSVAESYHFKAIVTQSSNLTGVYTQSQQDPVDLGVKTFTTLSHNNFNASSQSDIKEINQQLQQLDDNKLKQLQNDINNLAGLGDTLLKMPNMDDILCPNSQRHSLINQQQPTLSKQISQPIPANKNFRSGRKEDYQHILVPF
eukprot:403331637